MVRSKKKMADDLDSPSHMEQIRKVVNIYLADGNDSASEHAKTVYHLISSQKNRSVLDVVECLSDCLTDIDFTKRSKGTALLAEFMHCCPSTGMNMQEIETFVLFFCDRLRDHHSVQPHVIYAFLGLVSYHDITDELVIKILQMLFSEVHVQSLVQVDRRNVFNLFANLLKTKISALKSLSSDFVLGFIQAMDSERDPRNLMICFENSFIVLKNLDFSLFTEDFFEVLSCYFPIDFTPPKDMDIPIAKEDLVLSLRKCLTATEKFAPYAIPLYIEKLSADVSDAKKDALITFTECLLTSAPKDIGMFINDIWLQIRKDFLLSEPSEVSCYYPKFVSNLISCLSKSDTRDKLDHIVSLLLKDCLQTLKDPDMAITLQCSEMIESVGNASMYAHAKITAGLIPQLESAIQKYVSVTQRTNLLQFVLKILSVNACHQQMNETVEKFIDAILGILYDVIGNVENSALHELSLSCIEIVIKLIGLLKSIDSDVLFHHVFNRMINIKVPSETFVIYNRIIQHMTVHFEGLLLKDFIEVVEISSEQTISFLNTCCENEKFVDRILCKLISSLLSPSTSDNLHETILNCVADIIRKRKVPTSKETVFLPVSKYLFNKGSSNTVASCLTFTFNKLPKSQQHDLFYLAKNFILHQETEQILSALGLQFNHNNTEMLLLLRCIICPSSIELFESCEDMLTNLLKMIDALKHDDSFQLEQLSITIATIVNKKTVYSHTVLEQLKQRLISPTVSKQSIIALTWLTKALVQNWQPITETCIDMILSLLSNEAITQWVAEGFAVITAFQDGVLTKEVGAVVKLMHKQRFAQHTLPLLIEVYYSGVENIKASSMTAISNTLTALPRSMLCKHMVKLMPLLMGSLATSTNEEILYSTLSTLLGVLEHNKQIVQEFISTLAPRLTSLVGHERMKIRIISLQCLYFISTYSTHLVYPLKIDILRNIRPALDDKKRLVRKEAMRCSNAWHLLLGDQT